MTTTMRALCPFCTEAAATADGCCIHCGADRTTTNAELADTLEGIADGQADDLGVFLRTAAQRLRLVDELLPEAVRAASLLTDHLEGLEAITSTHHRHPVGFEARCTRCGDTFNPADENDLEHGERIDTGEPCGGRGILVGSWS